jgi:hypothetical protein
LTEMLMHFQNRLIVLYRLTFGLSSPAPMPLRKYYQQNCLNNATLIRMHQVIKTIKFSSNLVPLIESGNKIYTYRLGAKFRSIAVGEQCFAADQDGRVFALLKITAKSITSFRSLPLRRRGHEPYSSRQEQITTFSQYYSRVPKAAEPVIVLRFFLIQKI